MVVPYESIKLQVINLKIYKKLKKIMGRDIKKIKGLE